MCLVRLQCSFLCLDFNLLISPELSYKEVSEPYFLSLLG